MRKPRSGNKLKLILLALLLLVFAGGLFGLKVWDQREQSQKTSYADEPELERVKVYYRDSWYAMRDDLECILMMGIDKESDVLIDSDNYNNSQQADFLLLLMIDHTHKTIGALHINRDTMAEIDRYGLGGVRIGSFIGQLALAHTYGSGGRDSCRYQVNAVSRFLYDVPVVHYYSVTMDAIPVLNDLVGGVTVYVEDDFSKSDPSIVQGKTQTLKGSQALHFVRSRRSVSDNTNLSRMNRQRTYMEAFYKQLMSRLQKDESFSTRLGLKMADYSVSDLSTDALSSLADRVKEYRFTGIESIKGEAVVGEQFMEYYVDEDALKDQVIRLFFEPVAS